MTKPVPPRRVVAGARKKGFDLNDWIEKLSFSNTEQQGFLEDLATLINDGVPASRAIDVISRIEKGTKQRVAKDLGERIAEGRGIADGMQGWFNSATIELIRSGEQGGTLGENIQAAASALGAKASTFSSLAASMVYPLVVIITGVIVLIYLNHSIFPQFSTIKPISEWPAVGQNLVAMANAIQRWWWLFIALIVGIISGIVYMLHNYVGKERAFIDNIYGLSVYRLLEAARLMETLGLLIANGVVFKKALKIMEHRASPYLGWHLKMMEIRLGKGSSNIAEVLDTGLITDADILRLKAIAEAKGFEHALIRLGKQSGIRGAQMIQTFGKILGGVFLAVGAGFAIFMILGIYSVGSSLAT